MNSQVIWQRRYVSETDTFELVAPLFVGSESECMAVAPAIYNLICSWSVNDWREVCVDVLDNAGDAFTPGDVVSVGDFAWFRVKGRNYGVSGGFIWGEVDEIVNAGDYLEDVRLSRDAVVIGEAFMIGSDSEALEQGSWAMDLSECSGVGRGVK